MITKINRLFGSETRVRLLAKLILNSDRSFYMRELEKTLDMNFLSVHRELTNLKRLGLVTDEKKGKIRLFRINKSSPIYQEIRGLILKTEGLGNVIKNFLKNIKGIRYALIFGSIAKGTEVEASDVDLLIIGNVKEERIVEAARQAEKRIDRDVNYIIWSEKEFGKKVKEKHHLIADITKSPIIMIIGDEDGFRQVAKG